MTFFPRPFILRKLEYLMCVVDEFNDEKILQTLLLNFIDEEEDSEKCYKEFINHLEKIKIKESLNDVQRILEIIINISNYHHRYSNFYCKIDRLLLYFKDEIMQIFSNKKEIAGYNTNINLYKFFSNDRLLLFLLKEKMLFINKELIIQFIESNKLYFLPEIIDFIDKTGTYFPYNMHDSNFNVYYIINLIQDEKIKDYYNKFENFDEKRQEGEHEDHICKLIRDDLLDEFIEYMAKSNTSHSKLKHQFLRQI